MNSLFSSFDPNLLGLPMKFMLIYLVMYSIPVPKYATVTNIKVALTAIRQVFSQFEGICLSLYYMGLTFMSTIMFLILIMNMLGMIPFAFSVFTHIVMSLPLALSIWLSFTCYQAYKNIWQFLSSYLPPNSPWILLPVLYLIEVISDVIRPLTLSVRLTANLMSGHLLMAIISMERIMMTQKLIISFILVVFIALEFCVCMVQAYVFSMLSTLYLSDKMKH